MVGFPKIRVTERHGIAASLLAIVVLGALSRFLDLGTQSLWLDEVIQIDTVRLIGSEGFEVVAERDNVAPLSHWILWAWTQFFGDSETAVRMPSALSGVAAIGLMYLLGARLFGVAVGLAAAAITALSPFALWHAQDARMYALLFLLSVWIMLSFSRAIGETGRLWDWCSLTLATTLAVYTHQYVVLLSLSCGLLLLIRDGIRSPLLWRWTVTQVVAASLFLPWFILTLERFGGTAGSAKDVPLLWIPYTIFSFFYGYSLGPSVRELHWSTSISAMKPHLLVIVPLAVAAAWTMLYAVARMLRASPNWPGLLCLLCLGVPIALAVAAPLVSGISYNVRYATVAFPAFVLIIAVSVVESRKSVVTMMMVAVTAGGMIWSVGNWYLDSRYAKADLRSAAALLTAEVKQGDAVIISNASAVRQLRYYGFEPSGDAVKVRSASLDRVLAQIEDLTGNANGRTWLVESRAWQSDPRRKLSRALNRSASMELEYSWPGVTVRRYDSNR